VNRLLAKVALAAGVAVGSALAALPALALCPDAKTFSSGAFLSDVCWGCLFPVQIAGAASGSHFPDDVAKTCVCPSYMLMGTPTPGIVYGMWKPSHLVETVRQPGCFPTIGSSTGLGSVLDLQYGQTEHDAVDSGFHSTHIYTFPVGAILDMLTSSVCTTTSSYDVDIASISEIDPTYVDPMLSMVVNPEATLFSKPVARAVCLADAAAATAYKPLLAAFWCMGSWGQTYPLSGHNQSRSPIADASLTGARTLAIAHKRGMAMLHYGQSAVCMSHPWPIYPKHQYRWQVLYPVAQRNKNEWTGRSTLLDREYRNLPQVGEDYIQVLSTYENCCVHIP